MPEEVTHSREAPVAVSGERVAALVRAIRRAHQSPTGHGGVERFTVFDIHDFARRSATHAMHAGGVGGALLTVRSSRERIDLWLHPHSSRPMLALPPGDHPAATFLKLLQRAEHLRFAAQATRLRREARRVELAAWSGLLAHLRLAPEPLVVTCVYCCRVRTPDGAWRVPSRALSAYLRHKLFLSHSYCSECLRARGLDE